MAAALASTGWPFPGIPSRPPQGRSAGPRAARSPTGGPSQVTAFGAAWLSPGEATPRAARKRRVPDLRVLSTKQQTR
eukprot:15465258-Alexandrium_andersonii.AAC.1